MPRETMLHGWKAIAGYLGRDERTALRWAAHRGLPVRRVPGSQRGPVFASTADIDAWLQAEADAPPEVTPADAAFDDDAVGDLAIVDNLPAGPAAPPASPVSAPADLRTAPARQALVRRLRARFLVTLLSIVAIAAAVALFLFTRSDSPGATVRTRYADPLAKAAYLQATFEWNLRTRESLARAIRQYGDAIGREPDVPDAYVGLANTYLLIRQYGPLSDAEAYARASAAARVALALGPAGPDLHRALAFLAFWRAGDRLAARREFALALTMRPNDPLTHQWLATALSANGEPEAALREIGIARELDPTSTSVLMAQGIVTYLAGDRGDGGEMLRILEREQPQNATVHQLLARLALFEGRKDAFLREELSVARLRGDPAQIAAAGRLGMQASAGLPRLLAAMLADARQRTEHHRTGYFALAQAEALAGHRAPALAALQRSCAAGEMEAITARNDLWLSRAVSQADITRLCGRVPSLL